MAETSTLYVGDCLEVMPGIADGSVDAVVTDPPYGTGEHIRINGEITKTRQPWDTWNTSWLDLLHVLPVAFFCPPKYIKGGMEYADRVLAWVSKNPIALKNVYPRHGVQIILARGPFAPNYGLDWIYHPSNYKRTEHVHQKPLAVMVWLIETMSNPGDTILDPFMGSGTTGVACVRTGRRFIGIEIDEGYCEIARKRIADEEQRYPLLDVKNE